MSSLKSNRIEEDTVIQPGPTTVSPYLQSMIATSTKASIGDYATEEEEQSRTELDSHANMWVVRRHSYVLNQTGQTAKVNAFTLYHVPLNIPIVDAAIQ